MEGGETNMSPSPLGGAWGPRSCVGATDCNRSTRPLRRPADSQAGVWSRSEIRRAGFPDTWGNIPPQHSRSTLASMNSIHNNVTRSAHRPARPPIAARPNASRSPACRVNRKLSPRTRSGRQGPGTARFSSRLCRLVTTPVTASGSFAWRVQIAQVAELADALASGASGG